MELQSSDYFHFASQVPRLLFDGWTVSTTTELVLVLIGVSVTAFILESLTRISRECLRKVPLASTTLAGTTGLHMQWRRSDKVPLTSYRGRGSDALEKSPYPVTEAGNGGIQLKEHNSVGARETSRCCSDESVRILGTDSENEIDTKPLVEQEPTTCGQYAPEVSEQQKQVQIERMWKSLSLSCEERDGSPGINTRSRRVMFHFLQTMIRMCQMTIGFLFMLIIMTYNAWFLICVVGGAGLGYLVFSSDLERLYGKYAERYVKRKTIEEEAKRNGCSATDSCRKPSWNMNLMRKINKETAC